MHFEGWLYDRITLALLRDCTSEKVRTLGLIFKHCNTVCDHFCYMLPFYFLLSLSQKSISTIITTLVSPSLRRTSAPIQITVAFGLLGTQETFYYLFAGLFETDHLHTTPPMD